jgi:hypothetical protein
MSMAGRQGLRGGTIQQVNEGRWKLQQKPIKNLLVHISTSPEKQQAHHEEMDLVKSTPYLCHLAIP